MNAEAWLVKADQSLATARLVIDGDANAAVGAAYYAMFYAARAALLHIGQAERAMGKTHSGMVAAFNEFLAYPAIVEPQLGKSFAHEFAQRLKAAYTLDGVTDEDARRAVATADEFLAKIRALLASTSPHRV